MSQATLKLKKQYHAVSFISFLLNVLPILIFLGMAYFDGNISINSKLTLGIFTLVGIVLAILSIAKLISGRAFIWVLLMGLCIAIQHVQVIIYVIGICVIVDSMIVTPIKNNLKTRLLANIEIDKRG